MSPTRKRSAIFTAINCIDYLGAALLQIAGKDLATDEYHDTNGVTRIRVKPLSFDSFVNASCNQIRQAATAKPDVAIRMLEMLYQVGKQCHRGRRRDPVLKQAELVFSRAAELAETEFDRESLESRFEPIRDLKAAS